MDRVIEIKVGGNYLCKDSKVAGVRGEANVTMLRITFDESWDNYAKRVTFWDARGENPVERILTTDLIENILSSKRVYLVPIPAEPMREAGMLTFVIDGYFEGKRQRSMSDKLEVKDAPVADNVIEPQDPTPTQAEQLQVQIEAIIADIHDAVEAKESIENMSVSAETLSPGRNVFVEKSVNDGVVNLHFGIPRGERGKPGSATNLTDGEGVGSVESIDSGKAISDNAVSLGKDTVAGCKGYYIKSIDLEGKKIYLCKEKVKPEISAADNTDESFRTPDYEVGAEFNIVNGNHYILCASIAAIKNNAVTYKGDLGFSTIVEDDGIDGHTFSVPSQPEIGIVSIADGTASFGDGNKASAKDAFAAGRDNVAAGDFGAVFGRENVGGYGALVSGRGNYSPGQCSSTGGANNKNTGYCTDVHGQGLIGSGGAQMVRGTYNIPDKNSKFLEIIGNGKGDAQRSNARTVDRDGNAHHAGDVFVHSEWDENGVKKQGDRLVTAAELNMVETKFDDQLNLKKPLYTGLQTRGFVYTPGSIIDSLNVAVRIDGKTGILYNHTTINDTNSGVFFDNYSINPKVTTNGGTLYFKLLMRTNMKVYPAMAVLNPYDDNGVTVNGAFIEISEVSTTPNGEWEQHIIVVDNLPSNATTFNHVRILFAGRYLTGSSFYYGSSTLTRYAYFDVAGWAVFDDLDRARAYDLTVDASDKTKYGYNVQKNIDEKASKNLSNVSNEDFKNKIAESGYNLDGDFESKADIELSNITDKAKARENLGAAPMYTYGTEDIEAGSASTSPTGTLHFVYE